jgi:hypothetical protein
VLSDGGSTPPTSTNNEPQPATAGVFRFCSVPAGARIGGLWVSALGICGRSSTFGSNRERPDSDRKENPTSTRGRWQSMPREWNTSVDRPMTPDSPTGSNASRQKVHDRCLPNLTAMTKVFLWLCCVVLGFACHPPARAQATRNADMVLSVALTPGGALLPGAIATLTFTVRNNGPEALPSVVIVTEPFPALESAKFQVFPIDPSPCEIFGDIFAAPPGSGFSSEAVAGIRAGPLSPGASRICTVGVLITPLATGSYRFGFLLTDGQVFVSDPVPTNNQASVTLLFALDEPSPIPALRSEVLALVVVLFLMLGLCFRARL